MHQHKALCRAYFKVSQLYSLTVAHRRHHLTETPYPLRTSIVRVPRSSKNGPTFTTGPVNTAHTMPTSPVFRGSLASAIIRSSYEKLRNGRRIGCWMTATLDSAVTFRTGKEGTPNPMGQGRRLLHPLRGGTPLRSTIGWLKRRQQALHSRNTRRICLVPGTGTVKEERGGSARVLPLFARTKLSLRRSCSRVPRRSLRGI